MRRSQFLPVVAIASLCSIIPLGCAAAPKDTGSQIIGSGPAGDMVLTSSSDSSDTEFSIREKGQRNWQDTKKGKTVTFNCGKWSVGFEILVKAPGWRDQNWYLTEVKSEPYTIPLDRLDHAVAHVQDPAQNPADQIHDLIDMLKKQRQLEKELEELRVGQVNTAELNKKQRELDESRHQLELAKQKEEHPVLPPPPGVMDRWAVLVGISNYKFADHPNGFDNLAYADADAVAMQAALIRHGWKSDHICLLTNEKATKEAISLALESWLTHAGENDMILLFWSGHGFPDPGDPQRIYFVCHDTRMNVPATGLRMDRVRQYVEERNARNVVVLADSCHAGKIATKGKGVGVAAVVQKMELDKSAPKGWIFMTGAATDRTAIEHPSWAHGAFTKCLLDAMASNRPLTMQDLRVNLLREMPDITYRAMNEALQPSITSDVGDAHIWDLRLDPPPAR